MIAIKLISIALLLGACSTNGEMYRAGDTANGEFSILNTLLLPFAVAGAVVVGAAVVAAEPPPPTTVYVIQCRSRYRC